MKKSKPQTNKSASQKAASQKAASQKPASQKSPSQLIDAKIKELDDWRGETLSRLRALVKEADPEVVEEWKTHLRRHAPPRPSLRSPSVM
jgi:hypothetical protein